MPPEALAWNTLAGAAPATPVLVPLARDRVLSALLELQSIAPAARLSLTTRPTQKAYDEHLFHHNVPVEQLQDGIVEFIPKSEYFQSVIDAHEDILDWTRAPRFAQSAMAQDHMVGAGFTQGMSFAFKHGDRVVGSGHFQYMGVHQFTDAQYRVLDQTRRNLQAEIAAYVLAGDVGLTRREREILRLMADGLTNARISDMLVISRHTVNTHVEHILTKLRASNRVQAVRIAATVGLV